MTVFNMYNLCKMPCNVARRDYSHLYGYLMKNHQLLVKYTEIINRIYNRYNQLRNQFVDSN